MFHRWDPHLTRDIKIQKVEKKMQILHLKSFAIVTRLNLLLLNSMTKADERPQKYVRRSSW